MVGPQGGSISQAFFFSLPDVRGAARTVDKKGRNFRGGWEPTSADVK